MKNKRNHPPCWAAWVLLRLSRNTDWYSLLDDLEIEYRDLVSGRNHAYASVWYVLHGLQSVPALFYFAMYWRIILFKNYMKIAFRNIRKQKGYSYINIIGLSVGLTVVILILLFVRYELSYDRYHANAHRIYRVCAEMEWSYKGKNQIPITSAPMGPAMEATLPEVLSAVRLKNLDNVLMSCGEQKYMEDDVFFADPALFNIFSILLTKGDPETVLRDPFSVVISESIRKKYFGDENPMGETVLCKGKQPLQVTGVFRDMPTQSHFKMSFVIPFTTITDLYDGIDLNQWNRSSYYTYFLADEGADMAGLETKFHEMLETQGDEDWVIEARYFFQPLTRIHLHSDMMAEIEPNGDIRMVMLYLLIAFLILGVVCINYINLATARSMQRGKEVGIRKVVGANRKELIRQFLGESTLFTLLSFVIALQLVILLLPPFGDLVDRDLTIRMIFQPEFLVWMVGLMLLVGLAAGMHPAFILSRFLPSSVLRGRLSPVRQSRLRTVLVVLQFSVSCILIVCTLVIVAQLRYMRTIDAGYDREHIVVLQPRDGNLRGDFQTIKHALAAHPNVMGVATSSSLPNNMQGIVPAKWPGKPEDLDIPIYINWVDYDYIDLYGIGIVEGRNFSGDFASDAEGTILVNETAVTAFGWESIEEKLFTLEENSSGTENFPVVGMMKDFHMQSLHQPIEPLCFLLDLEGADTYFSIKIRPEGISQSIEHIRRTMQTFSPNYPFEYRFFDEVFDQEYRYEEKLSRLFEGFTFLAVVIACLGLLGLASYSAARRTKEIGIRKVLGATVPNLGIMMVKTFLIWVLMANTVAWPVAFYAMSRWLRGFAYRIPLGILPFTLAAIGMLLIAAAVVSTQALRAARTNPVDLLRYE